MRREEVEEEEREDSEDRDSGREAGRQTDRRTHSICLFPRLTACQGGQAGGLAGWLSYYTRRAWQADVPPPVFLYWWDSGAPGRFSPRAC